MVLRYEMRDGSTVTTLNYELKKGTKEKIAVLTVSQETEGIAHSFLRQEPNGDWDDELTKIQPVELHHFVLLSNYAHILEAIAEGLGTIAYLNQSFFKLYLEFPQSGNWTSPHPVDLAGWTKIAISVVEYPSLVEAKWYQAETPGRKEKGIGKTAEQALGFLLLHQVLPGLQVGESVTGLIASYNQYLKDRI